VNHAGRDVDHEDRVVVHLQTGFQSSSSRASLLSASAVRGEPQRR
jgi:hypothetical protein